MQEVLSEGWIYIAQACNGCAPAVESIWKPKTIMQIGVDLRHRPHYLSLLPSGPDEVRNRLLRSVRSK